MAGVKGRSGRKKLRKTVISDLMEQVADEDLPEIIKNIVKWAKEGDKQSAFFISDHILGRAPIRLDARIKAMMTMTAEDYELATRLGKAEEIEILGKLEDDNPLLPQGQEPLKQEPALGDPD